MLQQTEEQTDDTMYFSMKIRVNKNTALFKMLHDDCL
jgi:hypothetical protein